MAAEKIFRDWHLPNGMNLATNPSNSQEEQIALEDLFTGENAREQSQELFQRLIKSYAESLSPLDAAVTPAGSDRVWIRTYSPIHPMLLSSATPVTAANLETYGQRNSGQTNETRNDNQHIPVHTEPMNDITREEFSSTLSAIEERMDKRIDRMEHEAEKRVLDYRNEIELRDGQLRRELDLRQESFRAEQTARDAALSEKFAGFLAAQAERDKAWEKISEARFDRIEKDVSSIKTDTKKVSEDVNGIKVTMAKYLGAAVVVGALASAALGAAAKHFLS